MMRLESCSNKAPDGTGYNDLPKEWREVPDLTKSQFLHHNPVLTEHRQALLENLNGKSYYTSMRLEWFHDGTGIAFVIDRSMTAKPAQMRFFQFGCDHQYKEIYGNDIPEGARTVGSCIHHYICETCGHIEVQDSSD